MRIIGLTGSIAMGKSATAAMLKQMGCAIYDADAEVHRLYAPGGAAVKPVSALFGKDILDKDGGIDRRKLGPKVIGNAAAFQDLEAIVHPLLARARQNLMNAAARQRKTAFVLDVPLLMETQGDIYCDQVIVVSAPAFLQRARALKRADMTSEKLDAIIAKQVPDATKRRRAHQVIQTGMGRCHARHQIQQALKNPPSGLPKWVPGIHQKLAGKP